MKEIFLQYRTTRRDNWYHLIVHHLVFFFFFLFFSGKCTKETEDQLKEARRASELMGLRDLAYILTNMITGEGYLNKDVEMHFHERRCQRLLDIFVGTGKLAG